jgi:hypothetical protein
LAVPAWAVGITVGDGGEVPAAGVAVRWHVVVEGSEVVY